MVTARPNRTRPGVGVTRSWMWQRCRWSRPMASTRSAVARPSIECTTAPYAALRANWLAAWSPPTSGSSHRAERCPELLREELGLLPGGKVAALVDLIEVDEVGVRLLRPTPRRLILLAGKDAHGHRNGDAL